LGVCPISGTLSIKISGIWRIASVDRVAYIGHSIYQDLGYMPYIGHSIYTTYTRERVREAQGRLSRARGGAFSTCSISSLHTIHVAARHSDYLCTAKEKNQRQAKNIATQNNRQESQHSMSSGLSSGFFPISGHQQKVECGYGKNDDDIMI